MLLDGLRAVVDWMYIFDKCPPYMHVTVGQCWKATFEPKLLALKSLQSTKTEDFTDNDMGPDWIIDSYAKTKTSKATRLASMKALSYYWS